MFYKGLGVFFDYDFIMSALQTAAHTAIKYFKDSYHEMKNVVWPSRKQTISHTILVILFSAIIAVFLGSLDILFVFILEKLLSR